MEVQQDFRDLLALLNAHRVDHIIVGAYALAYHGVPRDTGDMDIFVRPEPKNAQRILDALNEFGFGSLGLTVGDFTAPDQSVWSAIERAMGPLMSYSDSDNYPVHNDDSPPTN